MDLQAPLAVRVLLDKVIADKWYEKERLLVEDHMYSCRFCGMDFPYLQFWLEKHHPDCVVPKVKEWLSVQ